MAIETITNVDLTTQENLQLAVETSVDYKAEPYKYAAYLPHYTPGLQPPLEEFEHVDVGLRADPEKKALLHTQGATFKELTPAIGTEVRAPIRRTFRQLHVHQIGSQIKDYPEILPVYRDFVAGAVDNEIKNNVSSIKWHSDMSYEINGMGTTIFLPLDTPESGGDTLYLSTIAAYNALSPGFREFLHDKSATHSGFSQAAVHENRERYIRDPIETVHPVVRTHPVTKANSLYVNRLYTRRITDLKEEESSTILNFLYNHIEHGQDWHIRVHWEPRTVAIYDNRVTQHSALRDFVVKEGVTKRHMIRITPQAERPYFDPSSEQKEEVTKQEAAKQGLPA